MKYEIVMPQLSDSMEEGKLIEWKVKEGQKVKEGDVVAEVESDKAVMDVESFKSGVVKKLYAKEGESIPVGKVMALIETDVNDIKKKEEKPQKTEVKDINKKEVKEDQKKPQKVEPDILEELFNKPLKPVDQDEVASPKAKAFAAKVGVDIEQLQKDNILPTPTHFADVKEYYEDRYFTPKALHLINLYHIDKTLFKGRNKVDENEVKKYIDQNEIPLPRPIDNIKKAIIENVTNASKKPVYHMYDTIDAALIDRYTSKEITITVWLLKVFAEAMMRHEGFRTTFLQNKLQIWPNASISVAMSDKDALYMPVIKDINKKDVSQIAKELKELEERVINRKITLNDLSGSTFGLSNLGMTGIDSFDAMINKDDSAIAAVGSKKNGHIKITLSVDHRVVNGMQSALFFKTLKEVSLDASFFQKG